MFVAGNQSRIWLCTEPADMRKSFNGLCALVKNKLGHDPLSGQYFVFINKRKTHMKILYFEPSGFCLWSKRLEQGRFQVRATSGGQQALSWANLQLILDGIEVQKYRQFKRYKHAA